MKKIIIVFIVAILLLLIYVVYPEKEKEKFIPFIELSTVSFGDLNDIYTFSGVLNANKEVQIASEVGGRIQNLNVEVGDRVEFGTKLAYIDNKINSANLAGLQNTMDSVLKLSSDTGNLYDEKIKSVEQNLLLLKNNESSTSNNYELKTTSLLTNSAILSSQINEYLGEILTIKNGVVKYKYSKTYEDLSTLSTISKNNAESSFIKFQTEYIKFKKYFDEHIINKNPTQVEIDIALTMSQEVLKLSKLALQDSYTMFTFTLAGNNISETDLATYKANITAFGASAEEMINNTDNIKSQIIQSEINVNATNKEKSLKLSEIDAKMSELKMESYVNETMLNMQNISAPIGGLIIKKYLDEGNIVNGGTPIFTLADDSVLKIKFDVPERLVDVVNIGQEVEIKVGESNIKGKISKIYPQVNEVNGKNTIEIEIDNSDRKYKIGSVVKISMGISLNETENKNILIPKEALVTKYGEKYVFVVLDKFVKKIIVKTGASNGDFVEIIEGLTGTEKVVVTGAKYLRDGDQVNFAN